MKTLNMLLMAAITIMTISVSAQQTGGTTASLKEKMKMDVMNAGGHSRGGGQTLASCSGCALIHAGSLKEQMKAAVTGRDRCTVDGAAACPYCASRAGSSRDESKCKEHPVGCAVSFTSDNEQSLSAKEKMKKEVTDPSGR